MKRTLGFILVSLVVLAGVGIGKEFSTGWGKVATATSVGAGYSNLTLNAVSVYNSGTGGVAYVMVNTTPAALTNAMYTLTNAVPVLTGQTYTFDSQSRAIIRSISFATVSAAETNTLYISGY